MDNAQNQSGCVHFPFCLQREWVSPADGSLFILPYNDANLSHQLTLVTSFFNASNFSEGTFSEIPTPSNYYILMKVFSRITNPVMFYLEVEQDMHYIQMLRGDLDPGLTKVLKGLGLSYGHSAECNDS